MANNGLEVLAEVQRETVRTLAALTEQVRKPPEDPSVATDKAGAVSHAVEELGQAVAGLSKELGGLPALVAGLAGGVKDGGSLLGGILKSGLGLAPLGLKIAGLFGGGSKDEPAPLNQFVQPPSLALEVAN